MLPLLLALDEEFSICGPFEVVNDMEKVCEYHCIQADTWREMDLEDDKDYVLWSAACNI